MTYNVFGGTLNLDLSISHHHHQAPLGTTPTQKMPVNIERI